MPGLDLLRREHDLIDRIFPVLEEASWRADHGYVMQDVFPGILDFLNNFISRCHYGREESVLFPAMVEAGVEAGGGVIADMLDDHGEARLIFRNLTRFSEHPEQAETSTEIAASVRVFDSLMRVHKRKEDEILFPLAEQVLSPAQMEAMAVRFDQMDAGGAPFGGSLERYAGLAADLEETLEINI